MPTPTPDRAGDRAIVLIDGMCVLCSRWYAFVTARDLIRRFSFVAIQSPEGRALAQTFGINPDDPNTFALVEHGHAFTRSDALLRIVGALPRWRWVTLLRVIPPPVRDALYALVARNRFRWFGRRDVCLIPRAD